MEREVELGEVNVVELKPIEVVALQSPVIRKSSIPEVETSTLGHIGMYDFEDTCLDRVKFIVKDKIGFGVIFKSSENSYHVYNPIIGSLQGIRENKQRIVADDEDHRLIGVEKDAYALRISSKGDKPKPKFVECVHNKSLNLREQTFSEPHLKYLLDMCDADILHNILNECKTVGDETKMVTYSTYENNHKADDLADAEDVING